ncbi:4-chlorobenzoate--CoA ligase [mine drainage metagenome]|uniref:4-chlorobenzoate--CoA ligase n=1 Tax=mine drainage metagenome TaxID=410659 RepID=A0A1J5QJ09_9ZZZZ
MIGVPDERYGEEVTAFVILKTGASATPDELIAWGKEQMAAYKYPRMVQVVESLPTVDIASTVERERAHTERND